MRGWSRMIRKDLQGVCSQKLWEEAHAFFFDILTHDFTFPLQGLSLNYPPNFEKERLLLVGVYSRMAPTLLSSERTCLTHQGEGPQF